MDAQGLINHLADNARLAARTLVTASYKERVEALNLIAEQLETKAFEIQEARKA
jgi:gamma-glutamyl phosphate reductase